ncbi:MAG: monofunctional biosynthetic peptidoglycan transglycosylase [Aliifodinibius sp.]|nr:monofunctional biosynthetic peptidoglycan transglycosylase [Fodinibius sp.]NIV16781.1 monofunctional biosynthetic peptidoglycan transglycosylase [Fodinibius sp.]NIY30780.1 monofunctional biosynthetic peptidoglycan transglycosylase [Fodinibius sp.]
MNKIIRVLIYLISGIFFILCAFVGYAIFTLPDVTELIDTNPTTTSFIEYRKQEAREEGKTLRIHRRWIDWQYIPKVLKRTIVVAEDAAFWVHEGIDWHEVESALRENWEEGKIVRGASTISQQTAKNLYLTPHRNIYRKLKEFLITKELESRLNKRRILEIYLNCIEMGEGIFGIRSASNIYFGKHPSQLDISEMVRLAAILPNPRQLHPNQSSPELAWRSRTILNRLRHYEFITNSQYREAKDQLQNFFDNRSVTSR